MRPDDLEEWSEVESSSWELNKQLDEPVEEVNEIIGIEKAEEDDTEAIVEVEEGVGVLEELLASPVSLEVVEPDFRLP